MRGRISLVICLCLFYSFCVELATYSPAFQIKGQDPATSPLTAEIKGSFKASFKTKVEPAHALDPLVGSITVNTDIVHRVWVDRNAGTYFGYDVQIVPLKDSAKFRVTIQPLDQDITRILEEEGTLRPWPRRPSSDQGFTQTRFPGPLTVDDGDTISLDVLSNSSTRTKLIDLITVTSSASPAEGAVSNVAPARDFRLEDVPMSAQAMQLYINGQLVAGDRKPEHFTRVTGALLWFYIEGRGRFIFSIKPDPGEGFQKIGQIQSNKITFSINGDSFEWNSTAPIITGGGNWNLWVLHEPNYRPESGMFKNQPYVLGAADDVKALHSE